MQVIMLGPNLNTNATPGHASYIVHAAGCRDIKRDMRRYGGDPTDAEYIFEATSKMSAILDVYDNGILEENLSDGTFANAKEFCEAYADEFHFCPCAIKLPFEAAS